MYLIVGLGNPGRQYEATRHNMGFDTVDCLIEKHNVPQGGVKFNAMYGKGIIGGDKAILMKPLSFMNLSGGPVRDMVNFFKIDPEKELIVRIKIGVGAKPQGWDLADHVLSRFPDSERKLVDEAIREAADAVEKIIAQGPDAAMNEYNRKKKI